MEKRGPNTQTEVTELHSKLYSYQSLGVVLTLAGCLDKEAKCGGEAMRFYITGKTGRGPGATEVLEGRADSEFGSKGVFLFLTAAVILMITTACRTSGPHGNNSQTAYPRAAAPRAAAPRATASRILTAAS